ncbi:hypothetical protein VFPBJ_10174 [Purpureocillium lilacinum]|uniref:Uncharacterized protein n=1 Tax=Purpureocillium lilacinum TaxID=33203 RepID=A0A179GCL0_PURLI|nr:hypothetical protein VFPBJ_10174 [Purpureocillium lilacinum]
MHMGVPAQTGREGQIRRKRSGRGRTSRPYMYWGFVGLVWSDLLLCPPPLAVTSKQPCASRAATMMREEAGSIFGCASNPGPCAL